MAAIAEAGSQRWLQVAVNNKPLLLNELILRSLGGEPRLPIEWLCPLECDDYCEYRDAEALGKLKVGPLPAHPLKDFWPQRGPVWDGLARRGDDLLLVEAKANIPELASGGTRAGPDSLKKIRDTLAEVQQLLAPKSTADWTQTFYQYANRLAFLYFLRHLNEIPGHLVFVYFLNADDVKGPRTREEWQAALTLLYAALGLPKRHSLAPYVHDVFIDVRELREQVVVAV